MMKGSQTSSPTANHSETQASYCKNYKNHAWYSKYFRNIPLKITQPCSKKTYTLSYLDTVHVWAFIMPNMVLTYIGGPCSKWYKRRKTVTMTKTTKVILMRLLLASFPTSLKEQIRHTK